MTERKERKDRGKWKMIEKKEKEEQTEIEDEGNDRKRRTEGNGK